MIGQRKYDLDALAEACDSHSWFVFSCFGINEDGLCTCSLGQSCKKAGKHPATPRGHLSAVSYPDAPYDILNYTVGRNIGVFCARSSLLVVDIDPRSGGDDSFRLLWEYLNLPEPTTVEALTGNYVIDSQNVRGRHLYFNVPRGISFAGGLADFPGIDIKHQGYVVAPPSLHQSGVNYEWKRGHAPTEIGLQQIPESLLLLLQRSPSPNSGIRARSLSCEEYERLNQQDYSATARTALAELVAEVRSTREGGRNSKTFLAALRVGNWASEGCVPLNEALNAVLAASVESGLPETEAIGVIVNGVRCGLPNPAAPFAFEPWMEEAVRHMLTQNPEHKEK